MNKDKQSPVNPVSRSTFFWIIAAFVIVGILVLASLFFLNTSNAPMSQDILRPNSSNAVESTSEVARAPAALKTERPRPEDGLEGASGSTAVLGQLGNAPTTAAAAKPAPNIIYNPPEQMTVGETKRIEVRITEKELSRAVLAADLRGEGEVKSDNILTGKYMSVMLCCGELSEDYPFDIKALNEYKQIVGLGDYTQWAFDVTPQKKGKQELNLSVTVHQRSPGGGEESYSIPVKTENIQVEVDPVREFKAILAENWQWLGLLIMIPLLVRYVTRSFKDKKLASISGNESVFISYRRDDSSGYTLAIYQKLKDTLGDDKVFMDMDDIPHGVDFSQHLEKVLGNASTVLVMIGENWLNASNEHGKRLDNPSDFVRMEIATALERDIRVIPVLLKNAQMPNEETLPEVLQSLSRRNAIRIHDDQFEASIQMLVESIG